MRNRDVRAPTFPNKASCQPQLLVRESLVHLVHYSELCGMADKELSLKDSSHSAGYQTRS